MRTLPTDAECDVASVLPAAAGRSATTVSISTPLLALGTLALAAVAIAWFVFSYGYIEDDAFIHLEFARSLAEGHGYAFNGLLTNGDTAPIWPLALAGIHSLGVDWIASAKLACAAGLIAAVAGIWYLARDLADGRPEQALLPAAAVLVTLINPFFAHWSFSGMETVTALGLSLWAIRLVFVGSATCARSLVAAVLIALGPLLRPELLLLGAIAGPVLLWRSWQALEQQPPAHRLVAVGLLALLMVLPLAIWAGYALETFGAIVPNTNLAKRGGPIGEIAPRLLSVYALGFPVTLALLPWVTLPRLSRWRAPAAVSVLLLWPLVCIGFYLANHTAVQTRYCLLSMPCMSIAVLWLIGATYRPRIFAGTVAVMVLGAAAVIGLIVLPHISNKERYSEALSEVASYLRQQLPPHSPVAVFAIGQIAFESRHPLVDIGGITDVSVIPYMTDPGQTLRWAQEHGARYYIAGGSPEPGAVQVFATDVPFIGWTFHRSQYSTRQLLAIYELP
jgi:hypothetical protein